MRATLLILALLGIALGAYAVDAQTLTYNHARGLMAGKKCSISPPRNRDYSWYGYKEMNGYAYKNTRAVGGIFKTLKNSTVPRCFRACVDSRSPGAVCSSFAYERSTRKCSLSTFGIPFDPTEPKDLKTATKWCPASGYVSGWVVFMYD